MPRPKAPYFPLYASELLCDPKMLQLTNEEVGILIRLWSWMWINDVVRGALFEDNKKSMTDETIAKLIGLSCDELRERLLKLVDDKQILKRGKHGELYSKRLRNYKTKFELYNKQTETKRKRNGNETETKRTISKGTISKGKLREVKVSKEKLKEVVELFCSTCPSLPQPHSLSGSRTIKIKARLKEHPDLMWWKSVFGRCESTPFLKGNNQRGWKVTFDWLIDNDKNALKVIEGNYEEEKFAGIKAWLEEKRMEA